MNDAKRPLPLRVLSRLRDIVAVLVAVEFVVIMTLVPVLFIALGVATMAGALSADAWQTPPPAVLNFLAGLLVQFGGTVMLTVVLSLGDLIVPSRRD